MCARTNTHLFQSKLHLIHSRLSPEARGHCSNLFWFFDMASIILELSKCSVGELQVVKMGEFWIPLESSWNIVNARISRKLTVTYILPTAQERHCVRVACVGGSSPPSLIYSPVTKENLIYSNLHSHNILLYLPPLDRPAIALVLPLSLPPTPHLFSGDSSFKCHFPAAVAALLRNTKFFLAEPGLVQWRDEDWGGWSLWQGSPHHRSPLQTLHNPGFIIIAWLTGKQQWGESHLLFSGSFSWWILWIRAETEIQKHQSACLL